MKTMGKYLDEENAVDSIIRSCCRHCISRTSLNSCKGPGDDPCMQMIDFEFANRMIYLQYPEYRKKARAFDEEVAGCRSDFSPLTPYLSKSRVRLCKT